MPFRKNKHANKVWYSGKNNVPLFLVIFVLLMVCVGAISVFGFSGDEEGHGRVFRVIWDQPEDFSAYESHSDGFVNATGFSTVEGGSNDSASEDEYYTDDYYEDDYYEDDYYEDDYYEDEETEEKSTWFGFNGSGKLATKITGKADAGNSRSNDSSKSRNNSKNGNNSGHFNTPGSGTGVYITKTGKKYHNTEDCKGLSNANAIYDASESEAISKGLEKCEICY